MPFVRGAGTRILWSLAGICELVAAEHGAATAELSATQVRKAILGTGKADKAAVEAWVRSMGHDPLTDDESDALALLYAWRALNGEPLDTPMSLAMPMAA